MSTLFCPYMLIETLPPPQNTSSKPQNSHIDQTSPRASAKRPRRTQRYASREHTPNKYAKAGSGAASTSS